MKLITKDERLERQIEDSTFYYHRITASEMENFRRKHMVRGELQGISFSVDVVNAGLVDWIGVIDEEGKSLVFDVELIQYLPPLVITELAEVITGGSGEMIKNLLGTDER